MEYLISAVTDVGTKREVNQDGLFTTKVASPTGEIAFAVLCDGMGGLQYGEIASRSVIEAFSRWAREVLPLVAQTGISEQTIRSHWTELVTQQNCVLRNFGNENDCQVGSTAVAILLTGERYYIMNIGDSRAYRLNSKGIQRITADHTIIEREVQLGNMTLEQAERAPMHNVLTRCIGVTKSAIPDFYFGEVERETVYLLCSDGFRHLLTPEEVRGGVMAGRGVPAEMERQLRFLVELDKQRGETDNISVVTVAAQ